jgi:outer membrane scaffolding protein for murein synthesis (MipA/OmpV family)
LELSASLGAFRDVAVSLDAELLQDIGGSDGITLEVGPTLEHQLSPMLGVEIGASTTFADNRHMEDYFGVSASQATASGLGAFDAEAGFKRIDLNVGAQWLMSDNWLLIGEAGIGRLVGDAADSPITENNVQGSVFAGVAYVF